MSQTHDVQRLDVLIVGAGISGIGAARYLRTPHPGKSLAMLEARGASGGTWACSTTPASAPAPT